MEIRQLSWTKVTFCSLFLLFIFDVSAQDSIKAKKIKVLPVPAFGYSPETKTYLGAVCLFNLNLYDDTLTRSSNAKIEFKQKLKEINWDTFHAENPFKESGLALYKWSPISDELKILDKEIVLNSMRLKWNLIDDEFKKLTKNSKFN